jgi:hypothetical protein
MYRKVALSLMVCFGIDKPMVEPALPVPPVVPEPKAEETVPEPPASKLKKGKGAPATPPKVRTRKVQSEDGFPQVPNGE